MAAALWELDPWGAIAIRRRPLVLAVVDGSQSMGRRDGLDSTRYQRALSDAQSLAGRQGIELKIAAGHEASLASPAKNASGSYTNIGAWLEQAKQQRPDALVLLSDGNNNAGIDPAVAAAGAGFPVFVLGYGPPEAGRIPAIIDAWAPERTELGKLAEVKLRLRSGLRPLTISTEVDGRPGSSFKIPAGAERTEAIRHSTEIPGIHRMRLFLIDGTDTLDRRSVSYRIEKYRMQVVCLCGTPDWNLRFLKQAMAPDPGIELRTYLLRQGQWEATDRSSQPQILDRSLLSKADLLILLNLRPADLSPELEKTIISAVRKSDIPILFLGSRWDETFRSREIYPLLPLQVRQAGGRVQSRQAMDEFQLSKLMSDPGSQEAVFSLLKKMPPLWSMRDISPASKTVSVMATGEAGGKRFPVWAWWYQGRARVAQLAVEDLWSWSLGYPGRDSPQGDTSLYGRLIRGMCRWLAGMPGQTLEVGPERSIYYAGEEVRLRGRHQPASGSDRGETVWISSIHSQGKKVAAQRMIPWRAGEHQATYAGLIPGEYDWQAELAMGGRVIERSRGRFWLEPNPSMQGGHVQQAGLLKRLADVSGGRYWDRHSRSGGPAILEGVRLRSSKKPGQAGPLGLTLMGLGLFLAEWYWRRRWGLK